jgi:hypothetical protein
LFGVVVRKIDIQEETDIILNPVNVCNISVQKLLPSCLLSASVYIKVYKIVSLPPYTEIKLGISHIQTNKNQIEDV